MLPKLTALVLSGFIFAAISVAKDWREKSSIEWTETNLWEILMDSPWVSLSSADFPGSASRGSKLPDRAHLGMVVNSLRYPMIRFLTAKPIRDAQAMRTIFMNPRISHIISIQDLSEEFRQDENEAGRVRLQRFAEANPGDIRVIGDPDYIVVSITMTQVTHCNFGSVRQEVPFPIPELENTQPSELANNTFLLGGEKKRIRMSHYQPPRRDRLGAKIFFPRFLPDGKPSVAVEDEQLQFETWIQGKKIIGEFNLREMIYKDKLEI